MKKIVVNALTDTQTEVEMTDAEVQEHANNVAVAQADKEARDAELAQKATDKASAKAKLIAGEALTEAEADTIVI